MVASVHARYFILVVTTEKGAVSSSIIFGQKCHIQKHHTGEVTNLLITTINHIPKKLQLAAQHAYTSCNHATTYAIHPYKNHPFL